MYSTSLKPVTHISFQEPENDPRNYVYYWIVRSEREDDADGIAVAMLYSLTYRQKQIEFVGEEECPLYTDLESLVVRSGAYIFHPKDISPLPNFLMTFSLLHLFS